MNDYLKYLLINFKKGNYTIGLLMILTIIIFTIILSLCSTTHDKYLMIIPIVWLIIGCSICISWNNYWYDKNKK